jgi:hypothetical protein
MLHKYSDLDIYEDFINGSLEPTKLQGSYLKLIPKYLTEEIEVCRDMIVGKFKKNGTKHELIERLKISTAHPLAIEYFHSDQHLFEKEESDIISKDVLKQLDVDSQHCDQYIVLKRLENHSIVGIVVESEWDELESDRLKYCYTNNLLKETVRITKGNLRNDIFSKNKDNAKSIVSDVQKLLTSYLNDILTQYDIKESNLKIKVRESYSNKDCAALTYLSIIDLLNFIYSHFHELMDHKQKVPYFSSVLNQYDFVTSAKRISKYLKKIELDRDLNDLVKDELDKILHLDIKSRITYEEISYFKNFLSYFFHFLEKQQHRTITQEKIIHFLIAYNFNQYNFYEYLIDLHKSELTDFDSTTDMEIYLLRKQTEYNQISSNSKERLKGNRDDIISSILKWINTEYNYVQELKKKLINSDQQNISQPIQLTTDLKVSELALLFKVMSDNNHFSPESKNELAKWIKQSFKNTNSQSFSIQNVRNNIYNPTSKSIEKIKKVGIEIVNKTNSI